MCIAGNVVVLARLRPDIVKLQDSMETPCCPIFCSGMWKWLLSEPFFLTNENPFATFPKNQNRRRSHMLTNYCYQTDIRFQSLNCPVPSPLLCGLDIG